MDCKQIQRSSSSRTMIWKYDVFVSFRGDDTRNNFADHLFGALFSEGFVTFKDDIKLRKGKSISTELLQAIEGSQILIVIFSKDYASSTWCLKELAKIVDCTERSGQTILPIFYDVNPCDVRKQSGDYEKAFVKHEERFKDNLEMVETWREALSQVANLSGWDVNDKPQHREIGNIIKEVTSILSHNFSTLPDDIVGMQPRVEELEKLLVLDSNADVLAVGICGMGGIGKSALATSLYCRISNQFHASCFIDDISKLFRDHNGPIEAQKQILCQVLNEESLQVYNPVMATNLMRTRLRRKKVLIVLDNVDEVQQLEKLALKHEWLGARSRIIIISRDEHILKEYKVNNVYKVQLLNSGDALQLFCQKAFKCDDKMTGYMGLTNEVLKYAMGLPLAIKALGSFLFGRDVFEWRSGLDRLREHPEKNIMDVLRISFDALKDTEKEIFLDISCFFHGLSWEIVEHLLDIRGFYPRIGVRVLIDKSLVTIDEYKNIKMHDLLKELGRSIVKEMSVKEPRKWSRLWNCNDLHNVLQQNMAGKNLEAIVIDRFQAEFPKIMRTDTFSKLIHLKFLKLQSEKLRISGSLNYLSNELVYLCWENYPFQYLPPNFEPDKLVELILPRSSITQLWRDSKPLHHVRKMDLSQSVNLTKLPDFRDLPNLESLNLKGCIEVVPNDLFGCSKLYKNRLLGKPKHAKHVEVNETSLQQQSASLMREESIYIILLLHSWPCFLCLQELDLSFCNLDEIPIAIGLLHSLISLNLGGNSFVTLPSSIKDLSKLIMLNLEYCEQLKYLPELPERSKASSNIDYRAGFYIFECPSLTEIERCYGIAFSWMIQLFEVHMQSSLQHGEIDIVIPRAEIPRWFNKQNVGRSISIDVNPYIHDENCLGISCCAILVPYYYPHGSVYFTYSTDKFQVLSEFPVKIRKYSIRFASNHLFLQFIPMEEFIQRLMGKPIMGTHDSIEFVASVDLLVKSCGYHWIFKEDLAKFSSEMMLCGNSSVWKPDLLTNG